MEHIVSYCHVRSSNVPKDYSSVGTGLVNTADFRDMAHRGRLVCVKKHCLHRVCFSLSTTPRLCNLSKDNFTGMKTSPWTSLWEEPYLGYF